MKINFSNVRVLRPSSLINRLKTRRSCLFIVIVFLLSTACGKVINKKRDMGAFNTSISFLMMEHDCSGQVATESKIAKSIRELYQNTVQNSPQSFFMINPKFYNYDTPLILSLDILNKTYQSIQGAPVLNQNAEVLYYLFNESRRYEDQKCSFNNLVEKKKNDIRPFLNIAHNCYKKFQNVTCDDSEYQNMSAEKEKWTRDNTVGLCQSFSKEVNCQAEFIINQKKKTIGSMINRYYDRFQDERFLALFKLRPVHQKYNCKKLEDNKTVMVIKVLESTYSHEWLVELLRYVEEVWSNKNFALKLELVKTYTDGVVTLARTAKGISYVPDNNNRIVYLSTQNDPETTKHVLAHEFGHVLGFPDCYIEFFDDSKKELVYYEISKNNTNIMCSLKAGVSVQDDYFSQLTQNSCLFN